MNVYVLNYKNEKRKNNMLKRFHTAGIQPIFSEGKNYNGPPPDGDIDTRNWSIMLSHMEMIRLFYESGYEYSVICEDDIYIHKDFKILVEDCIFNMEYFHFDIMLLGCLIEGPPYPGDCIGKSINRSELLSFYKYHESIWGAHCYLIKRCYAKHLLNYFNTPIDKYYSPDWIITKMTDKRSFVWPPLAIEEGEVATTDEAQIDFHKRCTDFQINTLPFERYLSMKC